MKGRVVKRVVLVAMIAGGFAAFFGFGLDRFVSLSYVKTSVEELRGLYAGHPVVVAGAYFVIYVAAAALSLPGAAVLTLAGGALFGLLVGTLVVSFASAVGATVACVVARFLLRDWVQARFGDRIAKVNEGVEREGAFYLFTLRLIPIFPFWMINLAMGLTGMSIRTFYWVSQVGMLAGTVVYVNAGKELAKITSLKGILSPGLIVSFALLGLFPLGMKRLVGLVRSRKDKSGALQPRSGRDGHRVLQSKKGDGDESV